MAFNGYVDEPFDVMCEGLFDNIEDILDFSNGDNVMGSMVDSCVADAEQLALPPPLPVPVPAPAAPSFHSSSGEDGSGLTEEHKICDELNITEDWLSNFLDDTEFNLDLAGAAIPTADVDSYIIKDEPLFRSSSPISVLEQSNGIGGGGGSSSSNISSSSSSSNSVNNDTDVVSLSPASPPGPAIPSVPARARTKRPRPAAFAPRIHITGPSLPPSSDTLPVIPTPSLDYNSIVEPYIPPPMKKKKMMKNNNKRPAFDTDESPPPVAAAAVRKCMHCGIQKTPQWRAGPMGPKTLCNACGVRYKSGRLFPEYRPAASPTFVPSVHSNSHKKVVEMRIKATAKEATNAAAATSWKISPAAKNCDLLLYIRRKE